MCMKQYLSMFLLPFPSPTGQVTVVAGPPKINTLAAFSLCSEETKRKMKMRHLSYNLGSRVTTKHIDLLKQQVQYKKKVAFCKKCSGHYNSTRTTSSCLTILGLQWIILDITLEQS